MSIAEKPIPPQLVGLADSLVEKVPEEMRQLTRRVLEVFYQVGFVDGKIDGTSPEFQAEVREMWRRAHA